MLIVISDPARIRTANEATILNALFDEGLEVFHLRKPEVSEDEVRRLLDNINPVYHSHIALHQHHEIANDYEITRFHFREKNRKELKEDDLKKLKDMNCVVSTSVHSIEDYKTLSADFAYTFFGPVFNSISKAGYSSVVDNDFKVSNKTSTKMIAIGGINNQNINKAFELGFDGAVLLGAIWQVPANAVKNFKKIRNVVCTISDQ